MRRLLPLLVLVAATANARQLPYQYTTTMTPASCSAPVTVLATIEGRWVYVQIENPTQDTWHLDWNTSGLSARHSKAGETVRTLRGTAVYPDTFTSRLTWNTLQWPPKEKVKGGLFKYSEVGSIEEKAQRAHLIATDPEQLPPGTTRTRAIAADLMAFAGWLNYPINENDTITLTLTLTNRLGGAVTCTLQAPLLTGTWPKDRKFETYFPSMTPVVATATPPSTITGDVTIASTPSDAELYVDGNFVGNTPATIKPAPGTHKIELKKAGHKPWSRDLLVTDTAARINATLEPMARMEAARDPTTTIRGRLFDGVKDSPLPGAHVFALAPDTKTIMAHTITGKERGPMMGTFELRDLPASGEVILVGFHEAVKANMWLSRFTLNGQANDLKFVNTTMATHTMFSAEGKGIGALLELAGWITHEVLTTRVTEASVELADALLAQLGTTNRGN